MVWAPIVALVIFVFGLLLVVLEATKNDRRK
jgi:hypothetical protein